jgi:hypothetical protein
MHIKCYWACRVAASARQASAADVPCSPPALHLPCQAKRICCAACCEGMALISKLSFVNRQAEELDPEFAAALAATEDAFNIPRAGTCVYIYLSGSLLLHTSRTGFSKLQTYLPIVRLNEGVRR